MVLVNTLLGVIAGLLVSILIDLRRINRRLDQMCGIDVDRKS